MNHRIYWQNWFIDFLCISMSDTVIYVARLSSWTPKYVFLDSSIITDFIYIDKFSFTLIISDSLVHLENFLAQFCFKQHTFLLPYQTCKENGRVSYIKWNFTTKNENGCFLLNLAINYCHSRIYSQWEKQRWLTQMLSLDI